MANQAAALKVNGLIQLLQLMSIKDTTIADSMFIYEYFLVYDPVPMRMATSMSQRFTITGIKTTEKHSDTINWPLTFLIFSGPKVDFC